MWWQCWHLLYSSWRKVQLGILSHCVWVWDGLWMCKFWWLLWLLHYVSRFDGTSWLCWWWSLITLCCRRCCGQVAWNPVSAGDCDCVRCDDCSDFYFTLLMLMVKLCCHSLLSGGEAAWNPVPGDECKVKRQRRKRLPRLDTGHTRQGTNSQSTSWTAVLLCC